jgi:hypothetical protein
MERRMAQFDDINKEQDESKRRKLFEEFVEHHHCIGGKSNVDQEGEHILTLLEAYLKTARKRFIDNVAQVSSLALRGPSKLVFGPLVSTCT